MSDASDLKELASLSEEDKAQLLQWYKALPESESELDALTITPNRHGRRQMSDAMVADLQALLLSVMGPDSPYQFVGLQHLYNAYRRLQDKHDAYAQFYGRQEFQWYMRRWMLKHAPLWEEKSATRHNKVRFQFPNGYVSAQYSGFGRKKMEFWKDDQKIITVSMIPLESAWNWKAYYNNQVLDDEVKV